MVGRTIGHYEIAERIGAGGMGEVYRARDTRLERDVAFKVVSTALSDADHAQERLRKEALALSRLSHPNIATVHDFDIIDGVTFVAMELVPGADVRDRIAAGPLLERDVLHIGAQAAAALQAAHEAGVVHRDLKPANLRITPDGRLKVLDFGLAVRTRPADEVSRAATEAMSAQVAGTMPYMAPEQLRGEPAEVRSDLYALAVVLHELATGRRPFDARPDAVLIDQILNALPPSPRDVNPRVSPGLAAIIVKGLEKNPDRRYQSAREMGVDLERLRNPLTTSDPTVRIERSPWTRPALRWATALGVGLLALALGWPVWRGGPGEPVLSFAPRDFILVADFDNQTGEAVFDTTLATAFAVGLGQSSHANLVSRPRISEALRRMGRTDSPRIDRTLGQEIAIREGARGLLAPGISRVGQQYVLSAALIDPQSAAEVRSYVEPADGSNGILDALGRIVELVRRDLGESLASIREQSRPLPLVTTASLEALQRHADGTAQWQRGQYNEAMVHYRRAIELDPDFAMAHGALGSGYLSFVFNNDKLGRQHFDRALALADRTTDRERMFLQAEYQNRLGDRAYAVTLYRAMLYRYPDDYAARFNLGRMLGEMRRFDEAAAEYEEVIRLAPRNAAALINLATVQSEAGRAADALVSYEKAFAIEPGWKTGGNLNHEYGFALVRAGRADEAAKVFALALAAPEERPRGLRSQALLDLWGGKYREAAPRLTEAIRLNQSLKRPLTAGRDLLYLAIVQEGLGDRRAQIALLDRAAAEMEQVPSAAFLVRVGIMYTRAGEIERARRLLRVAQQQLKDGDPALGPAVRRFEGELLVAQGRLDQGLEILNEVDTDIAMSPALIKESLGIAFERAGQTDAAIRAFAAIEERDALGWEPQQAFLHAQFRLAELHAKRGDRSNAVARLDRLLTLWQHADADLPLLVAARRLRGEL